MSLSTWITLPDLEMPAVPVRRFTVEEYLRMVATDVLDGRERHELLEGWIVFKMSRNPPHEVGVVLAYEALRPLTPDGWHVRSQASMTTTDSVPEPDLSIVRGLARDYVARHPAPEDLALVIEVAHSSLAEDRKLKGRIYARACIPVYWIVNLIDRLVEVYTDPSGPEEAPAYRQRADHDADSSIAVIIDGREVGRLAVRDLLP